MVLKSAVVCSLQETSCHYEDFQHKKLEKIDEEDLHIGDMSVANAMVR